MPISDAAGPGEAADLADEDVYAFPVSRAQRGLWLHERLLGASAEYLVPALFELRGPLDPGVLEQAIGDVVARHEGLRTWFAEEDGAPVQCVGTRVMAPLEVVSAAPDQAMRIVAERIRRPIPLDRPPLHRWLLVRSTPQRSLLLLTIHHGICDGWSLAVIVDEVAACYGARLARTAPALAEPELQYADYALWDLEEAERTREAALAWWRSALGPGVMPAGFAPDRPRPARRSGRGAKVPVTFDATLTAAMREIAASAGTSLFGVLAASLALLLRADGAGDRPVIGVVAAGRPRPELERVVGMFAATLPVPVEIDARAAFRQLAAAAGRRVLEAGARHDLPLDELAGELGVAREPGRMPFVDCVLNLQPPMRSALEVGGGLVIDRVRWVEETGTAKFDLAVALEEHDGRLSGSIEYALDLYEPSTVERIARRWHALLADVADRPDAEVASLRVLPEAERALVAEAWSRGPVIDVPHESLVTLFEARARERGEALAVIDAEATMSWAALDARSREIACQLLESGVRSGDVVAVAMDRSSAQVCAFLGVLRAGGTYLPLDPTYPSERLGYMLSDSAATTLIAGGDVLAQVPALAAFGGVRLDPGQRACAARDLPVISGAAPAYVIYTSGSTGRPKGVVLAHRGLANLAFTQPPLFGLEAQDRMLLWASPGFDASIWEMAAAIGAGAAMVTGPREDLAAGPGLVGLVARLGVTAVVWPPSVYAVLSPEDFPTLRMAKSAGEACPLQVAQSWSRGRRFFNGYGPTEATVCSTATALPAPCLETPSIGRPVPNFRVLVVDRRLQPVPIGVEGELLVGGVGVALGYLGRPDLSAEKFIAAVPGQADGRWYRTGDLARWRSDGTLEFRGRIDRQIKLRGIRIEPDEIAEKLREFPGVRDVAVVVQGQGLEQALVAFAVSLGPIDTAAALAHLRRHLPSQYIPRAIVPIERLPLTANGKVDFGALPAVDGDRRLRAVRAPANGLQAQLAEIWCDLLKLDRVGVDESFFELGGHSMLVTQMLFRARSELEVDVNMRAFLDRPTIEALAQRETADEANRRRELSAMHEDARLEAWLSPASAGDPALPPRELLLTGVTGFLGVHLLHALLLNSTARIHLLVRAGDDGAALDRVTRAFGDAGLPVALLASRVVAHAGDLAAPGFGWTAARWAELAGTLDAIVHAGAEVRAGLPYSALRASNVDGTREVIRLACDGRPTAVHFISTLSAFPAGAERLAEADLPSSGEGLDGGYAKSKWVAERLVVAARARGLRCSIIRPGRISASTRTGASNPGDLVATLLRGSLRLGIAPDIALPFEIDPVDQLAEAVVALTGLREAWGGSFHLVGSRAPALGDIAQRLARGGLALRVVPLADWRRQVLARVPDDAGNPLFALLPLLEGDAPAMQLDGPAHPVHIEQALTRRVLALAGWTPSALDDERMLRLVRLETGAGEAW